LSERLAKLVGGVAVIKVGGASEVEVSEKKDRVIDALNATKAAVAEGIVPGGGMALLYATHALDNVNVENEDQKVGVDIIRRALRVPAKAIVENSGLDGAVVVGKLLEESTKARRQNPNARLTRGMDSATGEYVDLIAAGIVDPTKVVRSALVDAASVASLMTTTEAMVVDFPQKKESSPGPQSPMGGMGGMGGMGMDDY